MNESKITVRYAKAFFSLAKEKQMLDVLRKDIELIAQLASESADFVFLLESPVIKIAQKIKLIQSIFQGKIDQLSFDFLSLIAQNKREVHIPGICRNFLSLYRQDQGVKSAVITSAIPLNKAILAQVKTQLEASFKSTVELDEKVKEELIGGFVLRVDDRQVDASVATQLREVKEKLLQTEINK